MTYLDSYHGKAYLLGSPETAVCSDCHGGHRILPASVPESTVSSENVVETCAGCHPGANENFADFRSHVNPQDPTSSWQIWFFWIAYVLLMRWSSFAAAHHPVHLSWRQKACTPRHRDRRATGGRFGASTCSTAGCTSSSSSASLSVFRACRLAGTRLAQWFGSVGGVTAAASTTASAIVTVVY
jgi:hypothetical protein